MRAHHLMGPTSFFGASMARSQRVVFRNMQGRTRHNRNWDAISQESAVIITAAQWRVSRGGFCGEGRALLREAGGEKDGHAKKIWPPRETRGGGGGGGGGSPPPTADS